MKKKKYTCPLVVKVKLDNTISLQMLSAPVNPPPRNGDSNKGSEPFKSPFGGDKTFG